MNQDKELDVRELEGKILKHAYSGVLLVSNDGEEFGICNRDSGFEFQYNNVWYEAKEGVLCKLGESNNPPHETVEQWISVNDRLPENGERYLIYISNRNYRWIQIGIYETGNYEWFVDTEDMDSTELNVGEKVTHWQPLPEPPKENEDE